MKEEQLLEEQLARKKEPRNCSQRDWSRKVPFFLVCGFDTLIAYSYVIRLIKAF